MRAYDYNRESFDMNNEKTKWVKALENLSLISQLGISMVVPILVCVWVGNYLDNKFGKAPLFLFIFIVLGVASSFMNMYKLALRDRKNDGGSKKAKGCDIQLNTTIDITKKVVKYVLVLDVAVLMLLIAASLYSSDIAVGLVLGSIFSVINFRLLAISVEHSIEMDPEGRRFTQAQDI